MWIGRLTPRDNHMSHAYAIEERFLKFHTENPDVYTQLVALARQAKAKGAKKIGIKMLWEVLRWNRFMASSDGKFKLNNSYHSRYARLIITSEPEFQGFFELRELSTEHDEAPSNPGPDDYDQDLYDFEMSLA